VPAARGRCVAEGGVAGCGGCGTNSLLSRVLIECCRCRWWCRCRCRCRCCCCVWPTSGAATILRVCVYMCRCPFILDAYVWVRPQVAP